MTFFSIGSTSQEGTVGLNQSFWEREPGVKSLSGALTDLAKRVKRIEASAAAVREHNDTALQIRCQQLETLLDQATKDAKDGTAETAGALEGWPRTKASLEHRVAAMRAEYGDWHAHLLERDPLDATRDAEREAAEATAFAACCLDAAEWAVIRAELVRAYGEALGHV